MLRSALVFVVVSAAGTMASAQPSGGETVCRCPCPQAAPPPPPPPASGSATPRAYDGSARDPDTPRPFGPMHEAQPSTPGMPTPTPWR